MAGSTDVTRVHWRAFAVAVALALGANVWISIVILPAAFVGRVGHPADLVAAVIPLIPLGIGVWRRSELLLLGVFPSALLIPVAYAPAMASMHVYGPIRLAVVATGLVGYLFGVSYFTSFHEPPTPISTRPLSSTNQPRARRWQRRERVYWMLAAFALACPLYLLWVALASETTAEYLASMFPGRLAAMTALLAGAVVAVGLGLYGLVFLGALRPHRTGDRALLTDLALTRELARRGQPRRRFYLGVAVALAAMLGLVALRHLS